MAVSHDWTPTAARELLPVWQEKIAQAQRDADAICGAHPVVPEGGTLMEQMTAVSKAADAAGMRR
jgi:hypothetical protein